MLDSPDDAVHEQLELRGWDGQERYRWKQKSAPSDYHNIVRHTWEAIQVDSPKQFEEADSMFREFGEVLVNHIKCWFKDCVQNGGNLRREERLQKECNVSFDSFSSAIIYTYPQTANDCRHHVQHFSISSSRDVSIVISQDGI